MSGSGGCLKMVVINAIVYDLALKYDKAQLGTEKLDLENERFRIECYGLNVDSFGRTLEDAKGEFLRRLKIHVDIIRSNNNAKLLTGEWASSERCTKSLEKIMLSKKRITPDIKHIDNFEIHFYNDFGDFE